MKKGSVAVVVIASLVVVSALLAGYFVFMKKPSLSTTSPSTQTDTKGNLTEGKAGDINRDGSVDAEDAELIRKSSPCNHVDPCWNKVVGKTKDGDNPIYVSDLDLNHDDNVNELDASAMSTE